MPMLTRPLLLTGLAALPGAARAFMAAGAGASLSPPHRHSSVALQFDDGGYDAFAARPPSDKQIAFAQRLSLQTEKSMPHEATVDAAACSQFIDTLLNQVPASEKQISYANVLAERSGETLPDSAIESAAAATAYIQAKTNGETGMQGEGGVAWQGAGQAGATQPTEKQLGFAVRLARQHKVGLSADVLAYKSECSRFIDEMLNQAVDGTAPSGPAVPPMGGAKQVVIPDIVPPGEPMAVPKVEVAVFDEDEIPF